MGVDDFVRGELKFGLMFEPSVQATPSSGTRDYGTLNIFIKEARDLPVMSASGLSDTVVKSFLLPDRSSASKRKTGVIKNNLNPVWEERLGYEHVSLHDLLSERVLELTLWHHDKHGNEFIGGMRLGGAPGRSSSHQKWMDAIGAEVSHWEEMLSQPGKWIEEWHTLRPSMVPRDVDLSKTPPPFVVPSLAAATNQSPSSITPQVKDETNLKDTEKPLPSSALHEMAGTVERTGISADVALVPDIQLDHDLPPSPPHSPPPEKPNLNGLQSQEQFEDEPKPKLHVSFYNCWLFSHH